MTKDEKILHELYRRSFANSTPKGDWDEILETAPINELGQKEIPFMDYECDSEVLDSIFESVMKEYRVPKWKRRQFSTSFYLGCSPRTKITHSGNDVL